MMHAERARLIGLRSLQNGTHREERSTDTLIGRIMHHKGRTCYVMVKKGPKINASPVGGSSKKGLLDGLIEINRVVF